MSSKYFEQAKECGKNAGNEVRITAEHFSKTATNIFAIRASFGLFEKIAGKAFAHYAYGKTSSSFSNALGFSTPRWFQLYISASTGIVNFLHKHPTISLTGFSLVVFLLGANSVVDVVNAFRHLYLTVKESVNCIVYFGKGVHCSITDEN